MHRLTNRSTADRYATCELSVRAHNENATTFAQPRFAAQSGYKVNHIGLHYIRDRMCTSNL